MPESTGVASTGPDPGVSSAGPASPSAIPSPESVVAMSQTPCSHNRVSCSPWLAAFGFVMPLLLVVAGCGEKEEIRSYRVPKTAPAVGGSVASQEAPWRIVVATLLAHDKAWFFKVEGDPDKLAAAIDEITNFYKTIKAPDDETTLPTWDVPEGWTAQPASGMRLATLVIPEHALEMAISELRGVGDEDEYLHLNVNRWLGQVSLPSIEANELGTRISTLEANGTSVWLFDATGKSSGGGMRPPMMGVQPPAPPTSTDPPEAPTSPAKPERPITFDLPSGWREVPARMMVAHVLKVGTGAEEAEVAISAFPSSAPAIADPLSNANRWRGEVLLDEITAAELPEWVEEVAVGEDKGTLVTALGESKGVIAAMVPKGGNVWFMKLHGTRENVERHREALIEWLKTVRIAEGNL